MRAALICSKHLSKVLSEALNARGIKIDEEASVVFVEKGCEIPADKIAVIFDYLTLDQLMDFLDDIFPKIESSKGVVIARAEDKYELIAHEQILYFEASGNHTYCITADGQHRVKEKLYELEKDLQNEGFVRVGKPYVVNIMSISEIVPWFGGRLLIKFKSSNSEIEVARNYVKNFRNYLGL